MYLCLCRDEKRSFSCSQSVSGAPLMKHARANAKQRKRERIIRFAIREFPASHCIFNDDQLLILSIIFRKAHSTFGRICINFNTEICLLQTTSVSFELRSFKAADDLIAQCAHTTHITDWKFCFSLPNGKIHKKYFYTI